MKNIDESALKAAADADFFSDFIKSKKGFITGCAFKAAKKYISRNDDEWSIALIAFSDAVKTYSQDKGGFLPYAEVIIKNRLIDYYRTEKKHKSEYLVDPSIFDCELNECDEDISVKIAVTDKLTSHEDNSIKDEIEAITKVFNKYGFSFFDLASCSPKSIKTKKACKQAVLYILNDQILMKELKETRQLPIKNIQKNTYLPRKFIEHHRRYLIAAIEMLSGEYPCLSEYVSFIRK